MDKSRAAQCPSVRKDTWAWDAGFFLDFILSVSPNLSFYK